MRLHSRRMSASAIPLPEVLGQDLILCYVVRVGQMKGQQGGTPGDFSMAFHPVTRS
jgi:hypothetical protein